MPNTKIPGAQQPFYAGAGENATQPAKQVRRKRTISRLIQFHESMRTANKILVDIVVFVGTTEICLVLIDHIRSTVIA